MRSDRVESILPAIPKLQADKSEEAALKLVGLDVEGDRVELDGKGMGHGMPKGRGEEQV